MELYVFLRSDGRASLDDTVWPAPEGDAPGAWLESEEAADRGAIRAFPSEELLWCLDDELWEAELAGDVRREGRAFVGSRARLLEHIGTWTPEVADELVALCAFRVRDAAVAALEAAGREHQARLLSARISLGELEKRGAEIAAGGADDAARLAGFASDTALYAREAPDSVRAAAVAAYVAAHALAGGDKTVASYDAGFADERRWQAEWLSRRLSLNVF